LAEQGKEKKNTTPGKTDHLHYRKRAYPGGNRHMGERERETSKKKRKLTRGTKRGGGIALKKPIAAKGRLYPAAPPKDKG